MACRQRIDFIVLPRAATSDIEFMFNGQSYIQHNGVTMGTPLAPVIADICVSYLGSSLTDRLEQIRVCE